MAHHTNLQIHKVAYDLLSVAADLVKNMPRDFKGSLNPSKTILQPVARGIDFVGQVIKPWHSTTRRRTVNAAAARIATAPAKDVHATANSYFGLLRQASHGHQQRVTLAHAVLARGHCVNQRLIKAFPKSLCSKVSS